MSLAKLEPIFRETSMQGATKDKTAQTLYGMMRLSMENIPIKSGYKFVEYKAYRIKVWSELVEGNGCSCSIYSPLGELLGGRRGLDAARTYIDEQLKNTKRYKVKKKQNNDLKNYVRFKVKLQPRKET
jgi:hypothetical protein